MKDGKKFSNKKFGLEQHGSFEKFKKKETIIVEEQRENAIEDFHLQNIKKSIEQYMRSHDMNPALYHSIQFIFKTNLVLFRPLDEDPRINQTEGYSPQE